MDTNKMRAEFEAAFVEAEVRLLGEGFRSSALHMIEQNTVNVRSAWWAWQASREAVVVELPKSRADAGETANGDQSLLSALMANHLAIEQCKEAIEAQGLRVAQ
ncbi:hypothetical protein [Pseudomonas sp.]|uniref:hypothetical protein n=1 Tax=Pseudomonas sp. TaxID=306 RepID=UPI0029BB3DFD|nr:hypothetical protein [Pseudomonas sp.]MDX3744819.1 hypothetical protein [Pseudomonas sp.]